MEDDPAGFSLKHHTERCIRSFGKISLSNEHSAHARPGTIPLLSFEKNLSTVSPNHRLWPRTFRRTATPSLWIIHRVVCPCGIHSGTFASSWHGSKDFDNPVWVVYTYARSGAPT